MQEGNFPRRPLRKMEKAKEPKRQPNKLVVTYSSVQNGLHRKEDFPLLTNEGDCVEVNTSKHKRKRFYIKRKYSLIKGKFQKNSKPISVDRRLGIPCRARNLRFLTRNRKEHLVLLSRKSKRNELLARSLQSSLVGLMVHTQWIKADLCGYFHWSVTGHAVFSRRVPLRLLSTVLNIVLNCKTNFSDYSWRKLTLKRTLN